MSSPQARNHQNSRTTGKMQESIKMATKNKNQTTGISSTNGNTRSTPTRRPDVADSEGEDANTTPTGPKSNGGAGQQQSQSRTVGNEGSRAAGRNETHGRERFLGPRPPSIAPSDGPGSATSRSEISASDKSQPGDYNSDDELAQRRGTCKAEPIKHSTAGKSKWRVGIQTEPAKGGIDASKANTEFGADYCGEDPSYEGVMRPIFSL